MFQEKEKAESSRMFTYRKKRKLKRQECLIVQMLQEKEKAEQTRLFTCQRKKAGMCDDKYDKPKMQATV